MKSGYDYIFKGKDGLQRLRIIDSKHVGLSKIDENNRVLKGYEKFRDFLSMLIIGKSLNENEIEKFTINGYYKNIGFNFQDEAIVYDTNKIEGYEIIEDKLFVTINYGNKSYKDIDTIDFDLTKYNVFKLGEVLLLIKKDYFVNKKSFKN